MNLVSRRSFLLGATSMVAAAVVPKFTPAASPSGMAIMANMDHGMDAIRYAAMRDRWAKHYRASLTYGISIWDKDGNFVDPMSVYIDTVNLVRS